MQNDRYVWEKAEHVAGGARKYQEMFKLDPSFRKVACLVHWQAVASNWPRIPIASGSNFSWM